MEKIKLDTTVSLSSVEKRRNVVGTSTVTKTNKFWRTEKAKEGQQCSTSTRCAGQQMKKRKSQIYLPC